MVILIIIAFIAMLLGFKCLNNGKGILALICFIVVVLCIIIGFNELGMGGKDVFKQLFNGERIIRHE
ncbi:hypothetical protein [Bacteroides sp.]